MARGDSILPSDLPFSRTRFSDEAPSSTDEPMFATELIDLPYADAKERANQSFDKAYVERLMHRTSGNVSEAARQAGMDRSNFRRLLKKVRGQTKGDDDTE